MIYIFDCGCRLTADQVAYDKKRLICPDHPGSMLAARESSCDICGKTVRQGPTGMMKKRCAKCEKAYRKEYRKYYNESRRGVVTKQTPWLQSGVQPKRNLDCKYYDACLTPPGGRLLKNPKACIDCPHYKPGPELDAVDFVKTGGQQPSINHAIG